ncbi:hypothetical protein G4B88_025536 [Cannabis sativa]|uniref:Uncharacterized protein n=1 Tax=Cannabis sativa TaxID=3483 RepID=A0A7J6F270_CANSA|nr:hypothetical protein G4B88_025536 [Cannabis sativa]
MDQQREVVVSHGQLQQPQFGCQYSLGLPGQRCETLHIPRHSKSLIFLSRAFLFARWNLRGQQPTLVRRSRLGGGNGIIAIDNMQDKIFLTFTIKQNNVSLKNEVHIKNEEAFG